MINLWIISNSGPCTQPSVMQAQLLSGSAFLNSWPPVTSYCIIGIMLQNLASLWCRAAIGSRYSLGGPSHRDLPRMPWKKINMFVLYLWSEISWCYARIADSAMNSNFLSLGSHFCALVLLVLEVFVAEVLVVVCTIGLYHRQAWIYTHLTMELCCLILPDCSHFKYLVQTPVNQ